MKIVRLMPDPLTTVAPQAPAALEQVVVKAIAKKKEERYATPSELVDAAFAAYGIEGGAAAWSERPQSELAEALLAAASRPAAPAEPPPTESSSEPSESSPSPEPASAPAPSPAAPSPAAPPATKMDPPPAPMTAEAVPGLGSGNKMLLFAALAGVGLLLLGGLAIALAILL
mgnify:FL=1